jgi:hypothetical protein
MTGAATPCQNAVKPDKTNLPQELASPIRLFEQRQFFDVRDVRPKLRAKSYLDYDQPGWIRRLTPN